MTGPGLCPVLMAIQASDGLILKGTLRYPDGAGGRRFPLAVLAHQYPATHAAFEPLVQDLLALGFATLAFDQRGHGESIQSPAGPVVIQAPADFSDAAFGTAFMASAASVRFPLIPDDIVRAAAWGVAQNFTSGQVLLVGGSVGGPGVLLAAPAVRPLLGVITLGAAGALALGPDAPDRIRHNLEAAAWPVLLASSEGDPFGGAASVRAWSEGLSGVHAVVSPGNGHAMAIYYDVRDDVRDFARRCIA